MDTLKFTCSLLVFILMSGVAPSYSASIKIDRNVTYSLPDSGMHNLLDVYYPSDIENPKNVLVFIHGGSWNSGKKETYWWLGRNFARKKVVTVTIDYTLSPRADFCTMASECAAAVKWVKLNIARYGGNPERIFVMGHSAGGHLAALINSDPEFFRQLNIENPIRGVILNDAFGLDMNDYLQQAEKDERTENFLRTFTRDQSAWKKGSPFYYVENIRNPQLILLGEKTYPVIKLQGNRFYERLSREKKPAEFRIIPYKRHIGMISHMINSNNQLYSAILKFMGSA